MLKTIALVFALVFVPLAYGQIPTGVASVNGTTPIVTSTTGSTVNVSCPTCGSGGASDLSDLAAGTAPTSSGTYNFNNNPVQAPSFAGNTLTQAVVNLTQGTAPATPPANTVQFGAPATVSSSYLAYLPTSAPPDPGGDVWVVPSGGGTGTWQAYASPSTTYINTVFNEASLGTALAGTTPAVCTAGCVGPWALASGVDGLYQTGGGVLWTVPNTMPDTISVGHTDYVFRFTVSAMGSADFANVLTRYTDGNNTISINICNGASDCDGTSTGFAVFDGVGGSFTALGESGGGAIGNYTVVMNGNLVTVTGPGGTVSGVTANTGSTNIGMGFRAGTQFEMSALSAKSN
jgi:hypothetical protein